MMHDTGNAAGYSSASEQSSGLWFLSRRELNVREREVWRLMAAGCSDAEIARHLGVNTLTVRFHADNLLVKLGVSERQEAVILAKQRDLPPGPPQSDRQFWTEAGRLEMPAALTA